MIYSLFGKKFLFFSTKFKPKCFFNEFFIIFVYSIGKYYNKITNKMELKKTPKADLENKKGLFLEIGLIVAIAFCILMFSYSQSEKVYEDMTTGTVTVEEEIVEITRQDEKPPEPVKQSVTVMSDILDIVKDDTKITTDFDFSSEFSEDAVIEIAAPTVEEETVVEEDAPFLKVEQMPSFRGGDLNDFRNWVSTRLRYPKIAEENGVQGKVILQFVVERDGTLSHIEVLSSPDRSLSEEAVRVVESSPKWTPGKQRGSAVRVKYTLPVDFQLN